MGGGREIAPLYPGSYGSAGLVGRVWVVGILFFLFCVDSYVQQTYCILLDAKL